MQTVLDLAALSIAYWAAFLLRFDADLPMQMWKRLLFTWPYVVALEFGVLSIFAIPRFSWRHIGLREATRIGWAVLVIAGVLLVLRLVSGALMDAEIGYAQYALVPVGVIVANLAFSFLAIVGLRSARRMAFERAVALRLGVPQREKVPTLLVGAGQAGALVVREIEKRRDLKIRVVGFLDDDRSKVGTLLHGVRVWGVVGDLPAIASRLGARQVIVTISDLEPSDLRRIVQLCESERLRVKLLPGLYQIIEERAEGLGPLRDVSIEDLLGRESVRLDMELVGSFLRDKCVLITGAGGSIGSELCRQVARFEPRSLVLVERSEFALFTIHRELLEAGGASAVVPRLCDICDADRLEEVFAQDSPQVVFHAAAHKHVPMLEFNPGEAIKNNVFGTKAVADAADRHGCEAFVLISTDKAVNPTSIMGATKRVTEMYIQGLSGRSRVKYVAVRFGNVLGSTGSVVPVFKAQIAAGGPVRVTHPEMKRYFMTIPEASQLVMQAAAMGRGGEIFVLDMGEPVKIVDLAHDMIRLSGLVPEVDVKVEFIGTRPGEKLFEELGFDAEKMNKTEHPKIFIGKLRPVSYQRVETMLERLSPHTSATSNESVREVLRSIVPEMQAAETTPDSNAGSKQAHGIAAENAGAIKGPLLLPPGKGLGLSTGR